MTDPFSLDALLTESVELRSAQLSLKTARKAVAHGQTSPEERIATAAKIRDWESKTEWRAAAVVAMFTEQQCLHCSRLHTTFVGLFQRQANRTSRVSRWVREATSAHLNLPKEQKISSESVPLCAVCAEAQGFAQQLPQATEFPTSRSF